MAFYKEDFVDIELTTGNIYRSFLPRTIGEGDKLANRFGIHAFRNGEAETLGGSCTGYFIRSDGGTVTITGTVSGNTAYVDLPEACYAIEGQFALAIKISSTSATGTLRIVDGVVSNTTTGTIVDPGTVIPSIEDLLDAIEAAVESIPADYSSLWASLAPAFSTSINYLAGQCVTYDGGLYRFKVNHSGTWADADVIPVDIGAELFAAADAIEQDSSAIYAIGSAKTVSSSSTGWRLVPETGFSVSNSDYDLKKYAVTAGKKYYIKTDDLFQFQNSSNVPASGTSNRIGVTYSSGGYVLTAPTDATYLIISTLHTGGEYAVNNVLYSFGDLALKSANAAISDNDLDNCSVGYIMLDSSTVYANAPYDVGKVSHVITYGSYRNSASTDADRYLIQYYLIDSSANGEVWRRTRSGGTWGNWAKIYDKSEIERSFIPTFKSATEPITDIDLNNCKVGYIFLDSSVVYLNAPYDSGKVGHVVTYGSYLNSSSTDANRYLVQYYFTDASANCEIWRRRRSGGTWTGWDKIYEKTAATSNMGDTVPDMTLFERASSSSQGENTGVNLRVMDYNIAVFNNDTSTYIPDEKLIELRKMFARHNADVLLIQEDRGYIDSSNTQSSDDYVYFPMYPYRYGDGGSTIHSKMQLSNVGIVQFSNGRNMRYGILTVSPTIKVLCVSAHPVWGGSTQEYIDARDTQYHEMCQWVNGEITLEPYGGGTGVYAPTHTHVVIGIDTNAGTAQDITNLKTRVSAANMIMANGGRFGFVYTCNVGSDSRRSCIDNIIVSNNIIINNFESLSSLYSSLYSDHVPLVADLTLL